MRRNVYSSCDVQLSNGKKYVAVHLLTLETLYFVVEVKTKVSELFNNICKYLGLLECELFGVCITDTDGCYIFLEPSQNICKYAPKQWKVQNNGVDNSGKSLFDVYLRVQFYVDSYLFINDKAAKLLYYLQLRENVVNYGQSLCEERAFLLASYALQADFGSFNPEKHSHDQYFSPNHYFPSWVIEQMGLDYIIRHLPFLHRDLKGMSKIEAQSMYIKEASDSIAPHNLHMYKLKNKKQTSEVWLAIGCNGVEIYTEEQRMMIASQTASHSEAKQKSRLSLFTWPDIGKLYFEKKKFEIHSVGFPIRKFSYYSNSEDTARHILLLCRSTHQFQLMVQSKMKEVKRREHELNRKKFRESYIYSDSFECPIIGRNKKRIDCNNSPPSVGDETGTQRISVISNASSNTTSGIVSDKVQSLDDSDRDDIDIEIMVNSPPAASLESLALSEPIGNYSRATSSNTEIPHHSTSISNITLSSKCTSHVHDKKHHQSDNDVPSCANSTKSTSSGQSNTTVKSVIPSYATTVIPSTQIITIISNCNKDTETKFIEKKIPPLNSNTHSNSVLPIFQSITSPCPLEHKQQLRSTNTCAKALPQFHHDLSVKSLELSNFSKLSERSESMNHIYENIPYFSQINGIHTPNNNNSDNDSPPPLPTSAPPQRTATRIGVSSLTRVHNKPALSVFKQNAHITNAHLNPSVAGSEPNLHNSKLWSQPSLFLTQSNYLSLPINGNTNAHEWGVNLTDYTHSSSDNIQNVHNSHIFFDFGKETRAHSDPPYHFVAAPQLTSPLLPPSSVNMSNAQRVSDCTAQSIHQSLNDITLTSTAQPLRHVGSDISINNTNTHAIFIPPPPDYANSSTICQIGNTVDFQPPNSSHKENGILKNKICINGKMKSSSDLNDQNGSITDLNQLRQKSRDLDLPLITALFNDRSLMMVPKTVPTCSRQRHLGTARDIRRFSCSYEGDTLCSNMKSNNTNNNTKAISKTHVNKLDKDFPITSKVILSNRPTSWHLEYPNNNLWDHHLNHQKQLQQNKFQNATADFIERLWAEHQLTT